MQMRPVLGPRRLSPLRSWPIGAVAPHARFRSVQTGESIAVVSRRRDHVLQPSRENSPAIPASPPQRLFDATCPSHEWGLSPSRGGRSDANKDYSKEGAKTA